MTTTNGRLSYNKRLKGSKDVVHFFCKAEEEKILVVCEEETSPSLMPVTKSLIGKAFK